MKLIFTSVLLQTITAVFAVFTLPLYSKIAGTMIVAEYLRIFSYSGLLALLFAGLSITLSSRSQQKYELAAMLYRCAFWILILLGSITALYNLQWALVFFYALALLTLESAKGFAVRIEKFPEFQSFVMVTKILTVTLLYCMYIFKISIPSSVAAIVAFQAFPSFFAFLLYTRRLVLGSLNLQKIVDFYGINKGLVLTRCISGGHDHLLRLGLFAVASSDFLVVFEFFSRIAKQSKAIIDNAISFLVRRFESGENVSLLYVVGFIIVSWIVVALSYHLKLLDYLGNAFDVFMPVGFTSTISLYLAAYLSLFSTSVLLHHSAAKSDFGGLFLLALKRFVLMCGAIWLLLWDVATPSNAIQIISMSMLLSCVGALWILRRKTLS